MSVWDQIIGQPEAVHTFTRAVAAATHPHDPGPAMTHAWLVTGPPGSGRSTLAAAFAAALQCPAGGCGACTVCRTTQGGGHPDVEIIRADTLTYSVDDARHLIVRSSVIPTSGRWQVVIIEDADRFSHEAVNVLLKVLEEPPQQLVWVLCAPSQEDVLPTIRSRTRSVQLRTPTTSEVSQALQDRYGIDPAMAAFAARASQGHIGRARALATDEGARIRRQEVLRSPATLRDLAACFAAADDLLSAATEDAQSISTELDASETADIRQTYGVSAQGLPPAKTNRLANSALKAAEKTQKSRRTRLIRDQVDRALVDLIAYYRDVLILQTGAAIPLINDEMRAQIQREASSADMPDTILRWEAIESARAMVAASGALPLVLEALMVELKDPRISQRT